MLVQVPLPAQSWAPASQDGDNHHCCKNTWWACACLVSSADPELISEESHFSWAYGCAYCFGFSVGIEISDEKSNTSSRGCFLQVGWKPAAPLLAPRALGSPGRRKVFWVGEEVGHRNCHEQSLELCFVLFIWRKQFNDWLTRSKTGGCCDCGHHLRVGRSQAPALLPLPFLFFDLREFSKFLLRF